MGDGLAAARLRVLLAPNASPMTLEGTRTFLIGRDPVAIIDPGPAHPAHGAAIVTAVAGAASTLLLTHVHPDHGAGAPALAARIGCAVRCMAAGTLAGGDVIATDAGPLVAVYTPGHTPDHVSFHWPARQVVFCGDLMMGGLDTALVAAPEGDLGAYLASLERVRALLPRVIHPAHGPPFTEPEPAIARYVKHRADREAQVLLALAAAPLAEDAIVRAVYGDALEPALEDVVLGAVQAYLHHLRENGRVRVLASGEWARSDDREQG